MFPHCTEYNSCRRDTVYVMGTYLLNLHGNVLTVDNLFGIDALFLFVLISRGDIKREHGVFSCDVTGVTLMSLPKILIFLFHAVEFLAWL